MLTGVLVWLICLVTPPEKRCPDFICFWAAGKLISSGQSPYDEALQLKVQGEYGYDRARHGLGTLPFLPYYYPPWFGMAFVALLPLGYPAAKFAWLIVNSALVILSGFFLRSAVPGVPRSIPLAFVPMFAFSFAAVVLGQTSPLIFILIVVAWRLLDAGRDDIAGCVLAWLTIKPQLTAVLLLGLVVWATRHGRWGVIRGFFVTLMLLCMASSLVVSGWFWQMLEAPRRTPPPTEAFPWIGTTAFLLLKTAGLKDWVLVITYVATALAALAVVLRAATDRERPLPDVISISLLTTFLVAPYGRHYDFPVLIIPFLVLTGTRLSERSSAALLVALLTLPYVHYAMLARLKGLFGITGGFNPESTFAWVPLLLGIAWLASRRRFQGAGPASVNPI